MVKAWASDRCKKVEQECLDRLREQYKTAEQDEERAAKKKKGKVVEEELDDEDGFC